MGSALDDLRCDIAEMCLLNKTEYTDVVLKRVLSVISEEQAASLSQLLDFCEGAEASNRTEMDDVGENEDVLSHRTGWSQPVAIWVPSPIGS
jgi:hypothetical protein